MLKSSFFGESFLSSVCEPVSHLKCLSVSWSQFHTFEHFKLPHPFPLPIYTAATAFQPQKMVSILLFLCKFSGWACGWLQAHCQDPAKEDPAKERTTALPGQGLAPTWAGLDVWVPSRSLSLSAILASGSCADVWPLAEHQGRIFPLVAACFYPSQ